MSEKPIIADEYREKVGTELDFGVHEVEKNMVRRFTRAIGDPNPKWETVAPPTFILSIGGEQFGDQIVMSMFPQGLLHGSTLLECYRPVKVGDKIKVGAMISSIRDRGKMAFVTLDITYTNQDNEPVAKCQQTLCGYEIEEAKNDETTLL